MFTLSITTLTSKPQSKPDNSLIVLALGYYLANPPIDQIIPNYILHFVFTNAALFDTASMIQKKMMLILLLLYNYNYVNCYYYNCYLLIMIFASHDKTIDFSILYIRFKFCSIYARICIKIE